MNLKDLRDQLIALAVSRQLVAVHSVHAVSGEDVETPAVVIGHIVKVTQRSVVVATRGFETPIPLERVTWLDQLSGAVTPAPEAA